MAESILDLDVSFPDLVPEYLGTWECLLFLK